jgi:O-antigen/teichoic acid export membrane protein
VIGETFRAARNLESLDEDTLIREIWARLGLLAWGDDPIESRQDAELGASRGRLGANALWLLLSRAGAQGLMVVFTLLVARRLGEAGLGAYAFMAAVVFMGNAATTFGTDLLIIREVAAKGDLSLLPAALVVQLALSALFIVAVLLGAPSIPNQSAQAITALQVYSLALVPLAFYTVFSAALRGVENMAAFMWLNLGLAVLQVVLVWSFIHPGSSVVRLAWLMLAAQTATAVLAALLCLRQIPGFSRAWRTSSLGILALVRVSAPIALLGMLKVLYQRASIGLLSPLEGAAVTGWYSAALRALEASQVIHVALLGALFPVMSLAFARESAGAPGWRKTVRFSWRLILVLGVVLALVLFLLAPLLVRVLYGPGFEPSAQALRVLAWLMIPFSVNIFISSRLLAERQERKVAVVLGISLVVLIALSAWLIPLWGLYGACLAAVGAETLQAGIYLLIGRSAASRT